MGRHKALAAGLLLTGLALVGALARADVFRCTDLGGKVSYQSLPCPQAREVRRLELGHDDSARAAPARAPALSAPVLPPSREQSSNGWGLVFLDGAMDMPAPAATSTPTPAAAQDKAPPRPPRPSSPNPRDKS